MTSHVRIYFTGYSPFYLEFEGMMISGKEVKEGLRQVMGKELPKDKGHFRVEYNEGRHGHHVLGEEEVILKNSAIEVEWITQSHKEREDSSPPKKKIQKAVWNQPVWASQKKPWEGKNGVPASYICYNCGACGDHWKADCKEDPKNRPLAGIPTSLRSKVVSPEKKKEETSPSSDHAIVKRNRVLKCSPEATKKKRKCTLPTFKSLFEGDDDDDDSE